MGLHIRGRLDLFGSVSTVQSAVAADRITEARVVHEGSSGVMLRIDVAIGKELDKRETLTFTVVGSHQVEETTTKKLRLGFSSTTTRPRLQSPYGAEPQLADLAWLIQQVMTHQRRGPRNR